jgi:hypothetical protein
MVDGPGTWTAYKTFLKKFLICSFNYGIREKSTGQKHPDRNPRGLEPRGFLRLGPDERGDQDAAAKIEAGWRGDPQDINRRMAKPLRRHSAQGLRQRIKGANPVICHDGRGACFWKRSVEFAGSGSDGSSGQR